MKYKTSKWVKFCGTQISTALLESTDFSSVGPTTMSQKTLHSNLWETDPELFNLIKKRRQQSELDLIASGNFTSLPVLQCLSSCLHNKYSERLPGQRYYGGN